MLVRCFLALVAAFAVFVLGTGGSAHAQPTIVISPPSGPCDAPLEARGSGFPQPHTPIEVLRLYLVKPGTSDVNMRILNAASVHPDGTFAAGLGSAELRCQAAALDSQAEQPTGYLLIAAASIFGAPPVGPGDHIPDIIALARYAYTTTTPRVPTETMTVSPTSGPCDGTIEISGSGFEPGMEVSLDLARPNSDAKMGKLGSAITSPRGEFSVTVSLGPLGCEAVQLDRMSGPQAASNRLVIYADFAEPPPRRGVPGSLARVDYTYTTTQVGPGPTMVISPPSGPCDATLEVSGSGYPPNADVDIGLGRPHSEGVIGVVGCATTSATGDFSLAVDLGTLGCDTAALDDRLDSPGAPKELFLLAYVPPAPVLGQSAHATYTYTTTHVAPEPPPDTLPGTGSPPDPRPMPLARLALAGLLAGLGIVLLVAPLCHRRLRS